MGWEEEGVSGCALIGILFLASLMALLLTGASGRGSSSSEHCNKGHVDVLESRWLEIYTCTVSVAVKMCTYR